VNAHKTGLFIKRGKIFIKKKDVAKLFDLPAPTTKSDTIETLEDEDLLESTFKELQQKKLAATRKRLSQDYGLTNTQIAKYNFLYKKQ